MARKPKEFKAREGRQYLVDAKEITADKIKQAGRKVLDRVRWE